jgi:hypothetical protein
MRAILRCFKIDVQDTATFRWPVKIRVRAELLPTTAPRKSPIFPAGDLFPPEPEMVLRTLELPGRRPCRRAPVESLVGEVSNRRRQRW